MGKGIWSGGLCDLQVMDVTGASKLGDTKENKVL